MQRMIDHLNARIVGRRHRLSMTLADSSMDAVDRYRLARRLVDEIEEGRAALAMLSEDRE